MRYPTELPRALLALVLCLFLCMVLSIAGCTAMERPEDGAGMSPPSLDGPGQGADDTPAVVPTELEKPSAVATGAAPHERSEPTLYYGTDQVFNRPPARDPVSFVGDAVSLNFEQVPLTEVVHAIMGDILGLDYVVEHPINGQVTLRTRSPVPRDQLLDILESLLRANQALMVRDREGRFFISASAQMRSLKPGVASSTENVVGYSTLIVPLQYISAGNMAEILGPVAGDDAFVRIDNMRNLLMLAGTRAQLEGWQEIIATFDVDLLKGMSVGIFPIENASIEDIDAALSNLLGKEQGAEGVAEEALGIGSMVRIMPVTRLNSILVVTPRSHYLKRIATWIERLDRAPDENFERRLYVYPVQNTSAGHLADMLSTIFGGSSGIDAGRRGIGSGVAPGFTPETVSSDGAELSGSGGSSPVSGRSRNFEVGDVRVVADEENNSLLIYATGKEYRKIQPALERLDIAATQVIIEASIIEVTLTDNMRYGLEWTFENGLWNDYTGEGRQVNGVNIGPQVPGFSYSVINASGTIRAVLNALASDNLLNVISSPSVMVLDNQTASIQVGDQVPVSTGTTQSEGIVTTQIQYRDTGVQLSVTPSVNAGGMVAMDIEQSVTDVGPVDEAGGGNRTFLNRTISSRVAVRTSESVVLGGLIRENKSEGSSGIPFLHDLPLVGPLFGTQTVNGMRTELLVVITPRVIFDDRDLRDVSREMRRQMRGLDLIDISESSSFLLDRQAGEDPAATDTEAGTIE